MPVLALTVIPPVPSSAYQNLNAASGNDSPTDGEIMALAESLSQVQVQEDNSFSPQATSSSAAEAPVVLDAPPSRSRIPSITLPAEKVSGAVAAQLGMSLLGHVLYLKNQVPFPVQQLSRLPSAKATAKTGIKPDRAAKHRDDLIQSFDTLSSHLLTTFTALSTAFARRLIDEPAVEANSRHQAYLAFLVGPSIGTPKSTVIFAIDGFEAKLWGRRDDQDAEHNDDDDNDEDDSEEDDGGEEDNEEDDEEEESDDSSGEDSSQFQEGEEDPAPPPSRVPVVHYYSTDEGQAIKAADRLLSRTLMQKEADGSGMASEMSPTQTHILLRAPRRFSHPAWVPQQKVSASMEKVLLEFLSVSFPVSGEETEKKKTGSRGKTPVEGVWVRANSTGQGFDGGIEKDYRDSMERGDAKSVDESDEMIWWSWDGKLVGFSDW